MSDTTGATDPTPTPAASPAPTPAPAPATPTATPTSRTNRRKVREGLVSSAAMDKTVVVNVIERVRHPRYAKTMQRTKHFFAHDVYPMISARDILLKLCGTVRQVGEAFDVLRAE